VRVLVLAMGTAAILLTGCSTTDDDTSTGALQTTGEDEAPVISGNPGEGSPWAPQDAGTQAAPSGNPLNCVEFLPVAAAVIGGPTPPVQNTMDAVGEMCAYEVEGMGAFAVGRYRAGEPRPTRDDYEGQSAVEEIVDYPDLGPGAFAVGNSNGINVFTPTEQAVAVSFDNPRPDLRSIAVGLARAAKAAP
jgi:hypothetical protein